MDMNELRRLLASGQISEDDLRNMPISGSSGDQNQLAQMMMPQPRFDIAPLAMNNMRVENGPEAGKITPLGPQMQPPGSPMAPQSMQQPSMQQPPVQQAPSRQIKLYGAGDGQVVDLGNEDSPGRPQLDLSRAPIDIPGIGKAFYSKDGRGAYVMQNGEPAARVMLGYDDAASRQRSSQNLQMDKTRQDIAQSQASVAHTQEEIRASKANNPDVLGEGGDISTLNPAVQAQVAAIARGDAPLPATRNGRMSPLALLAYQVNPDLKATTYQEKLDTTHDFAPKGKSGQALQAQDQAIRHASEATDAINELDNTGILPGVVNPIKNYIEPKVFNDTRQIKLQTAFNALGEELKKAYGGNSLAQLENWQKSLDPNASKDQQLAAVGEAMRLLEGAAASRADAYQRGMGTPLDFKQFLSPQSQAALLKLEGGKHAAGFGLSALADAAPASAAPRPGEMRKGYVYMGGDPSNQASWKPVR